MRCPIHFYFHFVLLAGWYYLKGGALIGSTGSVRHIPQHRTRYNTHLNLAPADGIHHVALKTRNITRAMSFYCDLLGFQVEAKFRAGPAKAAWLSLNRTRLEVIEVPNYMLVEDEGNLQRAPDLNNLPNVLGFNHMALDVTNATQRTGSLQAFLDDLEEKSLVKFGKKLRHVVPVYETIIGAYVYELAFIQDADGCLVEFLFLKSPTSVQVSDGWDPMP